MNIKYQFYALEFKPQYLVFSIGTESRYGVPVFDSGVKHTLKSLILNHRSGASGYSVPALCFTFLKIFDFKRLLGVGFFEPAQKSRIVMLKSQTIYVFRTKLSAKNNVLNFLKNSFIRRC